MNKSKICGIIPPIVTPFTPDLELDKQSLVKIINSVISGGVNGIFMLGTNGEVACLTESIKEAVITTAVNTSDGRVPVYINITSSSFLEALKLSKLASEKGADYIVLAPPFYFDMNQKELYNFIIEIADKSDIPVVLYNAPQYTKTSIEPQTVVRLAEHKNIVGLKDSSGSMFYVHTLLNLLSGKDFSILVGTEIYLGESVLLGLDGGINGGGNVFPQLYVKMYEAAKKEDLQEMKKLQKMIHKVQNTVYGACDSPVSIIIGLKSILSIRGLCNSQMSMPVYEKLPQNQLDKMEHLIKEFELLGF